MAETTTAPANDNDARRAAPAATPDASQASVAQNDSDSQAAPPPTERQRASRRETFRSPVALLAAAIALWIGSAAAFFLADYIDSWLVLQGQTTQPQTWRAIVMGLLLFLAVVLGFFAAAMLIAGAVRWAIYGRNLRAAPLTAAGGEAGGAGGAATMGGPTAAASSEQVVQLLRTMNARLLLSDTAKRIAYRQEDVNALRRAIRDDVAKGDFDAAMVLVQEMSTTFGYREEAEQIREKINSARAQEQARKIDAAVAKLDDIINRHDFERATRESAKLERLYPESEQVRVAVRRVAQAKDQYKQQLERDFLEAAERDDNMRAVELLKELDKYLTEEEAEPFRETARGVIGKQRDNLGVQFKMAVHDHEWLRAVNVGEQIIREFPNTRMADEARGMLDTLRQRAAEQKAAGSASS